MNEGLVFEVEVDPSTAAWLDSCARQRGETVAAAAAAQLRDLAVRSNTTGLVEFYNTHPDFAYDSVLENEQALAEAG